MLRLALHLLPLSAWTEHVALWWGYRFQPLPRTITLRSGARIHFRAVDYIQLMLYYFGTFEPHCLECLRRHVSRGATVIDVGANIGLFSIESSIAVGPAGRVIAIEAAPPNLLALRENLRLNNLKNIEVVETGVSDAAGSARLTLPEGDNLGMFTVAEIDGAVSYEIQLRTIDDLLDERQIGSVDLIKMDIEGSEFRALSGAKRTLEKYRPLLIVELNGQALERCGSSVEQVMSFLRALGYSGQKLGQTQPLQREGNREILCEEYLFVPQGKPG